VGPGGFGGGNSGTFANGGGGGLGAGAGIFVRQAANLTVVDGSFAGGSVVGGNGFASGQAIGSDLFLAGAATYSVSAGNSVTLSGTVGGGTDTQITGGFTKTGLGELVLGGSNSFTGGTTINGGTLRAANSAGSAAGSGPVIVASGGTLAGGNGGTSFADSTLGYLGGAVTVQSGGTLSPGVNGIGLLSTTGSVNLQNGSIWSVGLATKNARSGASPADVNTNDRIHTALDLIMGSSLTIAIDGGGLSFTGGNTYDYFIGLADGTVQGLPASVTFIPTDFASVVSPADFQLSRSNDAHYLTLSYTPTPIPEPGSMALLGAAAGVVGWQFRRRRDGA
jgi:autotransporter-associated beta strand protein